MNSKVKSVLDRMKNKAKSFMVIVFFRIVWALLLSILSSLILIFIEYTSKTWISLDYIIQENLIQLMSFFFIMYFVLFFSMYIMSVASEIPEPKGIKRVRRRIREVDIETRRLIAESFKWAGIFSFLIVGVIILTALYETSIATSSQSQYLSMLSLIGYVMGIISFLGIRFMNYLDWTAYHLQSFRKSKVPEDLEKALRNYNRMLGSSLSFKRLLSISQCVCEAYKIGNRSNLEQLNRQVDIIINSLKNRNIPKVDENLILLSRFSTEIIAKHKEILGFEVKYPYRVKFWEQMKGSLNRIYPQFIVFLVWFAFLIILAHFGFGQIISPPPSG